MFTALKNLTKTLEMTPKEVIISYEYFIYGVVTFFSDFMCKPFDKFVPYTTLHLRHMAKEYEYV